MTINGLEVCFNFYIDVLQQFLFSCLFYYSLTHKIIVYT